MCQQFFQIRFSHHLSCQAFHHADLALEAADVQARAEAYLLRAGVLKDMGQLDQAEEVCLEHNMHLFIMYLWVQS